MKFSQNTSDYFSHVRKLSKDVFLLAVVGVLAVSMTALVYAWSIYSKETSYDSFHNQAQNIYRVATEILVNNEVENYAASAPPLAPLLAQYFEKAVSDYNRILPANKTMQLKTASGKLFTEKNAYYVDSNFFSFFSFDLVQKKTDSLLMLSDEVLIEDKLAHKYFGTTEALGQTLEINNKIYKISGVFTKKGNTHLPLSILFSLNAVLNKPNSQLAKAWHSLTVYSYLKIKPNVEHTIFQSDIYQFYQRVLKIPKSEFRLRLQAITDIHLTSEFTWELDDKKANFTAVKALLSGAILFFILGLGILINVLVNRFQKMAASLSRKAKTTLLVKELTTVIILSIPLSIICLTLLRALLSGTPTYALTAQDLGNTRLWLSILYTIGGVLLITWLIVVYLSKYRWQQAVVAVLHNRFNYPHFKRLHLGTLVFCTCFLLIVAASSRLQLNFIHQKPLGFNENIWVVETPTMTPDQKEKLVAALQAKNASSSVSFSRNAPTEGTEKYLFALQKKTAKTPVTIVSNIVWADSNYTRVLKLTVQNNVSANKTDTFMKILVNQAFVKNTNLDTSQEQLMTFKHNGNEITAKVQGVIEDYNYSTLHKSVEPLIVAVKPDLANKILISGEKKDTQILNNILLAINGYGIQPHYAHLKDNIAKKYEQEVALTWLLFIAAIAFIAFLCLQIGLLYQERFNSLKAIIVQESSGMRREKNIKLVMVMGVAAFLAHQLSCKWLNSFAYHFDWKIWMTMIIFLIAATTIITFTNKRQTSTIRNKISN